MTSYSSNSAKTTSLWRQMFVFVSSLIIGLCGGLILLLLGALLLTETELMQQTAEFLGISSKTPWYFVRSSGTVAYLLMTGSTIWGLLLSTKIVKEGVPAVISLAMHNTLSWLAIALAGLHALALLFDSYYSYNLINLTLPFTGPYRPFWAGLGIIGFYLMLLTSISFYFRKQIGQKRWRKLHFLTFLLFILVTFHGVQAGTDSSNIGMMLLYWGSGLFVLFLTNYRLLAARRLPRNPID